jgi:dolichol-phosphate mannosyltransferase
LAKFFAPGLPAQTFADFDRSQEYLRASPIEGRVYPLSGRYFYLRTPMQSGRSLNSEASWAHFQLLGTRALLDGANASLPTMQTYMRVAGISHVLLDKQDPFTPQEFQNAFAQMYPTGFDSEYIRVLENKDSLAPAFLAREYLAMDPGTERLASGFLDLAEKINVVPVELDPKERSYPFLAGMGSAKGEVQLTPDYAQAIGVPFQRVPYREPRNNPSKMVFDPAGAREGWLVVTEAWHPDWHAYASGAALPVRKAFGGLMAVNLTGTQGPVEFIFQAPSWYDLCVWISGVSWVGVVGLLILMPMPFVPQGWKEWWTGGSRPKASGIKPKSSSIGKTVVVVPTYNERESIPKVLDRVLGLARKVDVLVVDDGSPDGTAELVKSRPEFNKRVYLLEGEGKAGLGTAYRKGFQWALNHGYGAAVEMDADLSHDPDDIPRLLDSLEQGAHLAVGSRYLGGVSVLNWPRRRILISTLGGWYVRFLTGLGLTDPTSGFKAIRAEVLRDLDWGRVGAEGYAFQIELHHAAWKQGYVVREIPIVFTERREGESKMSVGISLEAAWRVLRLAFAG